MWNRENAKNGFILCFDDWLSQQLVTIVWSEGFKNIFLVNV